MPTSAYRSRMTRAVAILIGASLVAPVETRSERSGEGAPYGAARVRLAPANEPGEPLVVHLRIEDAVTGKPIAGAKLFAYQTDAAGYYDRGADGRERGPKSARLHATAHSDSSGSIVIETIVPGSYPGSGIFRHIHYTITASGYETTTREIILDEPPAPTGEQKRWAERNGDLVTSRTKTKGGRSELRATLKARPAQGEPERGGAKNPRR